MRTMACLPDVEMCKEAEKARLHQVEIMKSQGFKDVVLTMVFQPLAIGAIKTSDARGGNPMGITAQNQTCKLHLQFR
jgi:hypothetical protein